MVTPTASTSCFAAAGKAVASSGSTQVDYCGNAQTEATGHNINAVIKKEDRQQGTCGLQSWLAGRLETSVCWSCPLVDKGLKHWQTMAEWLRDQCVNNEMGWHEKVNVPHVCVCVCKRGSERGWGHTYQQAVRPADVQFQIEVVRSVFMPKLDEKENAQGKFSVQRCRDMFSKQR